MAWNIFNSAIYNKYNVAGDTQLNSEAIYKPEKSSGKAKIHKKQAAA